jgi:hypothetical protein
MPLEHDREYWLERAEEMQALADMMSDHGAAQNILDLTESDTWLADQAAGQAEILAELSEHNAEQKAL